MDEKTTHPDSENGSEAWKLLTPQEFISVMLHELRNPVMVIKGYAALLSKEEAREHHPKALDAVLRNAETLEHLLKEMSKYYGYIQGKSDLEP
jgi:signal transduction histidine kinase